MSNSARVEEPSKVVILIQVDFTAKGALKLSKLNLRTAKKRSALRETNKSGDETTSAAWRQKAGRLLKWTKAAYLAIGVLIGLSINILSIPKFVVDFKGHIAEASGYVSGLVYRTEIWTGIFDTFPEGVVDMNDLGISSFVDAALEIEVVERNRLDGRVWWENSCDLGSPYKGLLLEGYIEIGGSSADVIVYDFRGGTRLEFFSGRLDNDGRLIHFSEFPRQSGLNGSIIAWNPGPAKLESWQEIYCEGFSMEIQKP